MRKKRGLTLIEILVVAGIVTGTMAALTVVMSNVFRASSKTKQSAKVSDTGWSINRKIRGLLQEAVPSSVDCNSDTTKSSFSFTSKLDGGTTTIICNELNGKISSRSATMVTVDLSPSESLVDGCETFVADCEDSSENISVPVVEFKYQLRIGEAWGGDNFSSQFGEKVVVR